MTIILGLLTKDYVALVADRRLCMSDSGRVLEDNCSKTVLWGQKAVIGYTGLAKIEGKPTNDWIASAIVASSSNAAETLRDRATMAFSKGWATRIPRGNRRMTFLVVAWMPDGSPILTAISNHHDTSGRLLVEPVDSFNTRRREILGGKQYYFETVGWPPLGEESEKRIGYALKHYSKKGLDPSEVLLMLIREVRRGASKANGIGGNLLSVVIPKKALSGGSGSSDRNLVLISG
jgi:hypothetical protein